MNRETWDDYNKLHGSICSKKPELISPFAPNRNPLPYVFSLIGWMGTGKSSLVNTIFTTVKNDGRLHTVAQTTPEQKENGTYNPEIYKVLDTLYVVDFPGWPVNQSLGKVDTGVPLKLFRDHLWSSGSVCANLGLIGAAPAVSVIVADARDFYHPVSTPIMVGRGCVFNPEKERARICEAKTSAFQVMIKEARMDLDLVVALTHMDDIPIDKFNTTLIDAAKNLGVDPSSMFPITNYVGINKSYMNADETWRSPDIEVPALCLIRAVLDKIDHSRLKIMKLGADLKVYFPQYHLEITSAIYVAKVNINLSKDVKVMIQTKIEDLLKKKEKTISFTVNNKEFGGDHAKGYKKVLILEYTYNFKQYHREYNEWETVVLP